MTEENLFRWLTIGLMLFGYGLGGYFRAQAERKGGKLEKSGNRLVTTLRLLSLAIIFPLFLYMINPTWVAWASWGLPSWLRGTAVVIAALMIPAIYWLLSHIGGNISPSHATREGHKLITTGPYRWIRHPLYTFGSIFILSISLVSALWWLTIGMVIPLAIIVWRTPQEEQNLIAQFGESYRIYMEQTGRYFPRLHRRSLL